MSGHTNFNTKWVSKVYRLSVIRDNLQKSIIHFQYDWPKKACVRQIGNI